MHTQTNGEYASPDKTLKGATPLKYNGPEVMNLIKGIWQGI
jgi:hypothetical protein